MVNGVLTKALVKAECWFPEAMSTEWHQCFCESHICHLQVFLWSYHFGCEHTLDKHEPHTVFSHQFLAVGGMYLILFCLFVPQCICLFKSMSIMFYSEEGGATVPCTRISKILSDSSGVFKWLGMF